MSKTLSKGMVSGTLNGISINSSIPCSSGNYNTNSQRTITYIVMHYTGNSKDLASSNANYFTTSGRGASAHFFVDDSNIYQSVKLKDTAWHCGASSYKHSSCRNANSIGIEMCCTAGNYKISETTKTNAAYLCARMCKLIGISSSQVDTYVLRHYDVTGKNCPAQMAGSSNSEWTSFKKKVKEVLESNNFKGTSSSTSKSSSNNYLVRVTANKLKIRKKASKSSDVVGYITDKGTYTITQEDNGFGKLKSGVGWINLSYTKKV